MFHTHTQEELSNGLKHFRAEKTKRLEGPRAKVIELEAKLRANEAGRADKEVGWFGRLVGWVGVLVDGGERMRRQGLAAWWRRDGIYALREPLKLTHTHVPAHNTNRRRRRRSRSGCRRRRRR